jgi:parallel beta-helix repeat protein
MKRKCLAVGIILLFVGTSIVPAVAHDTEKPLPVSRGKWLYVGGSGPGNYTRIQDAINASSDGDTVFVYDESSPYYEHLIITHQIFLIGENRETTIINGNGSDLTVFLTKNASYVTISGFTIQDPIGNHSTGIYIETSYNVISDNIIKNTYMGLELVNTTSMSIGNTITSNIITHSWFGVFLLCSNGNKIFGNYLDDNNEGIYVGGKLPSSL